MPVRKGVSKGEENGRRPHALRAGHPPNGRKAIWPARRAYKGRAWRGRVKLKGVCEYPFPYGPASS
jgi:hypothetical protein